jgi:general secretion pathway protein M
VITDRLDRRERRVLAVGLLAALLIIVSFGILGPYAAQLGHYHAAIDEKQFRLQRLWGVARQLPALQEEIKRLRKLAQTEGYFLQQNTAALSAAQIQERVAEMVTAQGGEIRSVQVAQEQTENGFTRVSVKVRMQATSEIIATLFSDIEARRPLLFVDDVQISVGRRRMRVARRGREPARENGEVELSFELYGYMIAEGR